MFACLSLVTRGRAANKQLSQTSEHEKIGTFETVVENGRYKKNFPVNV